MFTNGIAKFLWRCNIFQNNYVIQITHVQHVSTRTGGECIKIRIILLLILLLAVGGCQSTSEGKSVQSLYPDYLEFGGKFYVNSWELALTDSANAEKIGKVKKAHRLAKGAPVYEISGYPGREVIAVKEADNPTGMVANVTGFSVYVWHEESGQPSHYPDIPESKVHQIQIFKGTKLIRELKQSDDVQTFLGLMQQQGPHNEFPYDQTPQYTVLYLTDQAIGYNYGILEKNGVFGLPHIESELPAEIARFFSDEGTL